MYTMKNFLMKFFIAITLVAAFLPQIASAALPGAPKTYDECIQRWRDNPGSISQADAEKDCQIRFNSQIPLNADGSVKTSGGGGIWDMLYNLLTPERWLAGALGWS